VWLEKWLSRGDYHRREMPVTNADPQRAYTRSGASANEPGSIGLPESSRGDISRRERKVM
jgi:hypothetical protein